MKIVIRINLENEQFQSSNPIVTDLSTSSSLLHTPSAASAVAPSSAISPDSTQEVASPTPSSTFSSTVVLRRTESNAVGSFSAAGMVFKGTRFSFCKKAQVCLE